MKKHEEFSILEFLTIFIVVLVALLILATLLAGVLSLFDNDDAIFKELKFNLIKDNIIPITIALFIISEIILHSSLLDKKKQTFIQMLEYKIGTFIGTCIGSFGIYVSVLFGIYLAQATYYWAIKHNKTLIIISLVIVGILFITYINMIIHNKMRIKK